MAMPKQNRIRFARACVAGYLLDAGDAKTQGDGDCYVEDIASPHFDDGVFPPVAFSHGDSGD